MLPRTCNRQPKPVDSASNTTSVPAMPGLMLVVPTYASYHCFLRELSEEGVRRGWRVAVVCDMGVTMGQERDPGREEGIEFIHFDFPRGLQPLGYLRAARRLRAILRRMEPTIVHAHFSAAILATAMAGRGRDAWTTIGTFQGLQFPLAAGWKKRVYRWAETFASRRMRGVWVLTEDDLQALKRSGTTNAHLQRGYGFGCRFDRFDPKRFGDVERASLREKWRVESEEAVFLFIGRTVDFKGFPLVVRGFRSFLNRGNKGKLLIVGDRDPLHPTGLRPREEAALDDLPEVVRCGWQRDVVPFLAIADALVHPSAREGVPVGCMEAIAMGVRLIAADVRGSRELLALTGQTPVRPVTPEAIADELEMVATGKRDGNSGGGTDLDDVREKVDRFAYVREQFRIYEEVAGEPKAED